MNDRREYARVDDTLIIEWKYKGAAHPWKAVAQKTLSAESVSALLEHPGMHPPVKPGEVELPPAVMVWMSQLHLVFELLLKSLVTALPNAIQVAQHAKVNLGGGGIRVTLPEIISPESELVFRLWLPPATRVEIDGIVTETHVDPNTQSTEVGVAFTELPADTQDHLLAYIIHRQAERIRARGT